MSVRGHAPVRQVHGPFLGGREIVIARLVDPQAVGLEIGGHGDLRQGELPFCAAPAMISAGRKCVLMTRSHGSASSRRDEATQVELLDGQPQAVAAIACPEGWAVEQVVEVAEDVRGLVDQIEVGLAVEPAEGGVGQFQNVEVADDGFGHGLPQGQLDGLGGAHVAGADRRGQDQDPRLFGGHGWALVGVGTPYRNRRVGAAASAV